VTAQVSDTIEYSSGTGPPSGLGRLGLADGDVPGRAGAWRPRCRRTYSVFDHRARPGYIDRDAEIIVGLQTDAPLKRAIMPDGGWRVVETGLRTYGYEVDPRLKEIFTRYRKAPLLGGPADRGQADGQVLAGRAALR
jgi:hypothetical protein